MLVPAITFSATAAAVLYCNLIPVFVDINQNDLNMNVEDLKKYTSDCVAVMPFILVDIRVKWIKLCNGPEKNLIVIEDCAETCGGYYKGKN